MYREESVIIAQSAENGTHLFVAMASDSDQEGTPNSQFTFSILDTSLPFSIDPIMGNASVSSTIPQFGLYQVPVGVTDMGDPQLSSSAIFNVSVAPPNLHNPAFPTDFTAEFHEAAPASAAFIFNVNDGDTGEEGEVTLSLLVSEYSANFTLTQNGNTGMLYLNDSFDRETLANFSLLVQAVDNGNSLFRRTSEAELTVIILDVNDNAPVFENTPYEVMIPEDTSGNYVIFQASATDADIGPNAEILFSLNNSDVFAIDGSSGNITVTGQLLRATRSFYMVEIIATDQGPDIQLSSSTFISITITEVNDNAPVFTNITSGSITIDEDTEPGTVFLELNATDVDTGEAGEVFFSLQQTGIVFALQENSLVLNSTVDFEVCCSVDIVHS